MNPAQVIRPTVLPAFSKLSGIIVSASIVRMAPAANACTTAIVTGAAPPSARLLTPGTLAVARSTMVEDPATNPQKAASSTPLDTPKDQRQTIPRVPRRKTKRPAAVAEPVTPQPHIVVPATRPGVVASVKEAPIVVRAA